MSNQVERILFIIDKLQDGQEISTTSLHTKLIEKFGELTLRTVQRDFNLIKKLLPSVNVTRNQKNIMWNLPRHSQTNSNGQFVFSDFLSKITKIDSLEHFTYNFDTFKMDLNNNNVSEVITGLISNIKEENWIRIKYFSLTNPDKHLKYNIFPRGICISNQVLYLFAFVPRINNFNVINLANILEIEQIDKLNYEVPEASIKEALKFIQDNNSIEVKLKIDANFVNYYNRILLFENQISKINKNGDMIINAKVSSPKELFDIIYQHEGRIKINSPKELKQSFKESLREAKNNI